MSEIHIVTVGTSILRNAAQSSELPQEIAEKVKRWVISPPGSPEDVEAGEKGVPGQREFRAIYDLLKLEPRKMSAELNSIWLYLERGRIEKAELLASDSGACEFCAKLLKEYLTEQGIEAEAHRIAGLGKSFDEGLYNLLDRVSTLVKLHREKGGKVYLNATGGFKPETAVLYAAACVLGADRVYYIHETMKDVVEVPAPPLTINPEYAGAVKRLAAGASIPEKALRELELKGLITQYGREYRLRKWVELLLRLEGT